MDPGNQGDRDLLSHRQPSGGWSSQVQDDTSATTSQKDPSIDDDSSIDESERSSEGYAEDEVFGTIREKTSDQGQMGTSYSDSSARYYRPVASHQVVPYFETRKIGSRIGGGGGTPGGGGGGGGGGEGGGGGGGGEGGGGGQRIPKSKGVKHTPVKRKRLSEDESKHEAIADEDSEEDYVNIGQAYAYGSPMGNSYYGSDRPVVGAASAPGRALPTSFDISDMSEVKYKSAHPAYGPASYVSALYRPFAASKDIKYNEKPRYKIMEAAALIGVRPRLEGKEETKRTVSDAASTPSVLSPQQPVVYLDNYRSEGIFDHRGGQLAIPSQGLTLFIPPGALPKDTSKKITIEVLRDVPTNIVLRDDEMIVTKGFQCHPSGLYFQVGKPARLRIVHCANVIDSKKIQTVLYSWSHDEQDGNGKVKVERIVQTSSCRATRYTIEISLEHFSGGILAFIWNWWYRNGKLMSFMPFLPRAMPSSRRVMMELRMVNKPHVTYWKNIHVLDKNGHYQAAKDDDDEMTVKQEDLQVELQLERESPLSQSISSKQLRKTKHTVYFDLNLSGKPDDSLVVLNLKQGQDHLNIKFRTRFCEHPTEPENSSSSAVSSSEQGELEGTSVKRPSEDASDNEVSVSDLEELVNELGDHEDVGNLALKLGFTHLKWQSFRKMNRDGRFDGTRTMLFDWKKKTLKHKQRSTLRKALEEAHFAEAAENLQGAANDNRARGVIINEVRTSSGIGAAL